MPRTDDERIADEKLCLRLLAGYDENTKHKPYDLSDEEEKEAHAALARLVRDDMHGPVAELLALAIDPYTPARILGMTPTKRVQFLNRGRGKPSKWAHDQEVVAFIVDYRRNYTYGEKYMPFQMEAAFAEAIQHFGMSRGSVVDVWSAHQKMMKAEGEKLTAGTHRPDQADGK